MPRPSTAGIAAEQYSPPPIHQRIKPPADLDGDAKKIFMDIVIACRPEHFQGCDVPLLASYCRAVVLEKTATKLIAEDPEKVSRGLIQTQKTAFTTMRVLCVRLRVSPQGRQPTIAPGTNTKGGNTSFYDNMMLEENGYDGQQ